MSGRLRSDEKKSQHHKAAVDERTRPKRDTSNSRTRKSPSRTDSRTKSPSRTPKSPKKPQTRKPNKSPVRNKSPARKSPARNKSPARKSPSRQRTPVRFYGNDSDDKKSFVKSRSTPVVDVDTDSDSSDLSYVPKIEKPRATVQGRTRRLNLQPVNNKAVVEDEEERNSRNLYSGITRRSIHSPLNRETERVVHLKESFTTYEQKVSEFSDEDEKVIDSIESRPSQNEFVTEFGGWFGALFLIMYLPFYVIFLNVLCNNKKCSFSLPILEPYTKLSAYFDLTAFLGFTVYSILLALLTALPFGGRKVQGFFNKNGKQTYVVNGFFALILMHLILIGLELYKIPIIDFIYDKYLQLAVSSVIVGILFSVYLYLRSFFVPISTLNPNGDTNSIVYNFFMGREINPRMFDVVDIRMFLIHIIHITVALLNSMILCKSLGLNSKEFRETLDFKLLTVCPTTLSILTMVSVYFVDALVFEDTWIGTFEVQHEGVGYMSAVAFISTGFTYSLIPKYVMDMGVKLGTWQLSASIVQFIIGYTLYRGSNNQKYAFRRNPYSPAVAHLETIPTAQGKKLLVSGFWGFVRHPNYLGDMILNLSFFYYAVAVPPTITCLLAIPLLIHRTVRDGYRCKQKYGAAWDRYCQRVKYVLIPKIY